MSSSDKFPDWDMFDNRNVPENIALISPSSEIAADLQKFYKKFVSAQKTIDQVRKEGLELLVQQAIFVNSFAEALSRYESELKKISQPKTDIYKHLRVLKDQMLDTFTTAGFEIFSPIGHPFDEVADFVNVQHWRHHDDFASEVVAEVLEPIVKYKGEIVGLGRVIMGAPKNSDSGKISGTTDEKTNI